MPTYEYRCSVCEQHFDVEQSFSDPTLETMPGCDEGDHQLKKVFSAVGISFKGSGFYKNDSRGKSSSTTPSSTTSSDSSSGSSTSDSSGASSSSASTTSTSSSSGSSSD